MSEKKVVILDYGVGNVKSIANAVIKIGANAILSRDRKAVLGADAMILPGVGAFAKGMENLESYGLVPLIRDYISTGKPFLGICLGMQMMMEESDEFGLTKGLGLIKGRVERMSTDHKKLPHIAWNHITLPNSDQWNHGILNGINQGVEVYFVHTYAAVPENVEDILANCEFDGETFCAAIQKENVFGTQFHPEKSGEMGLKILENFINL